LLFIKYPVRRIRLAVLSICHFTVILLLPLVYNNWSWTCLLYPWPNSLQVFDPATSKTAFVLSILIGFIIVPAITWEWAQRLSAVICAPRRVLF
jgi:hypothetical protein